MYQTLE